MVPGTTQTGMQTVSEKKKKINYSKENDFSVNIPTFRRFKRGNPCGTHTLKNEQFSGKLAKKWSQNATHLSRFVEFSFVLYNCHEYLNLFRMSLMGRERERCSYCSMQWTMNLIYSLALMMLLRMPWAGAWE